MFGLNALRNAIAALAANLTGLAGTVADVNAHLRQRAALDAPESVEAPALPAPTTAGMPIPASTFAQDATGGSDGPEAASTAQAGRNGKLKPTKVDGRQKIAERELERYIDRKTAGK